MVQGMLDPQRFSSIWSWMRLLRACFRFHLVLCHRTAQDTKQHVVKVVQGSAAEGEPQHSGMRLLKNSSACWMNCMPQEKFPASRLIHDSYSMHSSVCKHVTMCFYFRIQTKFLFLKLHGIYLAKSCLLSYSDEAELLALLLVSL